ncbi:MAG: VWA domain-containing protein [Luteimonas sp.]
MQRHALATALLGAIALSACQSTAPNASADTDAAGTAVASQAAAADIDEPMREPDKYNAASGVARKAEAKSRGDVVGAADAAAPSLDRIEVTGSRIKMAQVEAAPMEAGNVAPMPAAPPPSLYFQPSNTEKYAQRDDNPVHRASEQPVSTFSIDVDTGSYANVRRMLREGVRPPADAVRAEELINYFDYGHPAPASLATPFRTTTELAPAPWNGKRQLLMIGIKGYDVPKAQLPPANLVFLIDTSGSMDSPDKLPLLKQAFGELTRQLRTQDRVSIVVYAGSAGLVLPPTPGDHKDDILAALDRLQAGGSTNGGDGIRLAYATAKQAYMQGGVNRVILATDGDFNVGTVDQGSLKTYVGDQRKSGIALTTLGFGEGNYNDAMAEQLADVGDGNHAYIDTLQEARKVLVQEMGATLLTIAKDVKIQIEFNPALVAEYRLIGYENRLLNREDFANDKVDAGDIGAGHEVTALYEITPVGSGADRLPALRYGALESATAATKSGEIAHLRLRYKRPGEDNSRLIETPVLRNSLELSPGESMRFAAAVAAYADALRGGTHLERWNWSDIAGAARSAMGSDRWHQRAEFVQLVDAARKATAAEPAQVTVAD